MTMPARGECGTEQLRASLRYLRCVRRRRRAGGSADCTSTRALLVGARRWTGWAGSALCPDGLVIDLSKMRQVIVDPHSRVAIVPGGAKVKDVAAAAGFYGLVAALGNCGEVGMAGLTLGGG